MKKIILSVAAVSLVATALAANPWTVTQYNQNGVSGNVTAGVSELSGYQAGPVWGLGANLGSSYGFGNGAVVYGNIATSRTWDAQSYSLPAQSSISQNNHSGQTINSFAPTVGVQYSLNANTLVGAAVSYGNYAYAPGGGYNQPDALYGGAYTPRTHYTVEQAFSKSVGYSFNPYAQYTFGQSTVMGSFNYNTLWNSNYNTSIQGNGVANKGTVAYSYALTPALSVGVTGAMQEVNANYRDAAIVQYQNANNYQAAIGTSDYAQIMPGLTYNCTKIQGLSFGLQTGLTWFNTRNSNVQDSNYGAYANGNFASTFVFIPSVNYTLPIADGFNFLANAEYNGVKVINGSNGANSLNGQTLNSSFQVGTGISYNF